MSFVSVLFADTGDYLRISDPKDVAGQRAWARATAAAIAFAQNPGEAAGAKLLALVGEDSSLGDPTDEGFLDALSPAQRVVALEQLAHAAATAHHLAGRNADGSRNPAVEGVVTLTPSGEAIISRPLAKAAVAEASLADQAVVLRAAAALAGAQHGELQAQAAIAEREAADLAKAATARPARRRRTWGELVMQRRLDIGPSRTLAKAATDDLDAPAMLYKQAQAGGLVPVEELYQRDAPRLPFRLTYGRWRRSS